MKETVIAILTVIFTLIIIGILLAIPTMLLWNMVMPDVFGLTKITFFQALWLSLLGRCLFTGFEGGKDKD